MGAADTGLDARHGHRELRRTLARRAAMGPVPVRRRVSHVTAKNFQLDLFDPDDGDYEYSAVTTNKRTRRSAAPHSGPSCATSLRPGHARAGIRRAVAPLRLQLLADDALYGEPRLADPDRARGPHPGAVAAVGGGGPAGGTRRRGSDGRV